MRCSTRDDKGATERSKLVYLSCAIALACFFSACNSTPGATSPASHNHTFSSTGGSSITYNTDPQAVILRVFYGGGRLGTLELSPEISIYGDGSYILGPGLQMQEGQLTTTVLEQLLHTLVDSDGLLALTRQQFDDVPDQNATYLQLALNNKQYAFLYGPFGNLSESTQDMQSYTRLGAGLTSIRAALTGSLRPYSNSTAALLVHQDFSPDLTQNIPAWTLTDIDLANLAIYECGAIPQDITSPNASTGCLTYTVPSHALVLSAQQKQAVSGLLRGQTGVFYQAGLYYQVMLRVLLPDELTQHQLAMLGSVETSYAGIPLFEGPVPTPVPTP